MYVIQRNQSLHQSCFGGWFGDNCSQPVCMEHCDFTNEYCIQPGECLCKYSWDGVYCNVSKDNNETEKGSLSINSEFKFYNTNTYFIVFK